ncbi:MAG TPA: dienelactone hydrolase family protein [Acidimicrobiia bacterium]|jgi:carboxymethylenebutenolidase|nr:dienelactone hydrolase family protein [Acidimicrobiia bacterium]
MAALAEGPRPASAARVTLAGRDDVPIEAIVARPDDGEPSAGLVLHPDLLGVRPLFDDLCRRVATHGYAVCCPEPFARAPAATRDAGTAEPRLAWLPHLDDDQQLADLTVAGDALAVAEVSVLGFCMGGMQTLKAAATGRFRRAVPFYGMIRVPAEWRGPGLHEPLDTAAAVCPTLAVFGGSDPFTPPADIEALRAAWRGRDDCEVVVFPDAEHGFVHDPARPAHRPDDAADAWRRALRFLDR